MAQTPRRCKASCARFSRSSTTTRASRTTPRRRRAGTRARTRPASTPTSRSWSRTSSSASCRTSRSPVPSKYPQPLVSLRPSRVARPLPPSPHHALSSQLINGALHEHDVCASAKESLLHILSVLLSVPAFDFDKLPAVLSSTLIQVSPSRTRPPHPSAVCRVGTPLPCGWGSQRVGRLRRHPAPERQARRVRHPRQGRAEPRLAVLREVSRRSCRFVPNKPLFKKKIRPLPHSLRMDTGEHEGMRPAPHRTRRTEYVQHPR